MVTSYTQLLARDYKNKLDAKAQQSIEFAVQGARLMEALLADLREYWSVDKERPQELVPVDCNALLGRVLANLESAVADAGATVTHDTLPAVRAEQYPLTLLFQNLLSNAIKYRRPDVPPRIVVSVDPAPADGGGQQSWKFSVADNGIGVEKRHLEEIFAPFKRLHGLEIPGTGLGLAMCRRIAERYGGRIWAESVLGKGSTFYFTLPSGNADV